jgi:hypothetical protein
MENTLKDISQLTGYMPLFELNYNINISLKNRYVYVETAKVASSTIKHALLRLELESAEVPYEADGNLLHFSPEFETYPSFSLDIHHSHVVSPFVKPFQLDEPTLVDILNSKEYFTFCFVRNPYARVLSCYLDKIMKNSPEKVPVLRLLGRNTSDLEQELAFEEFVDAICSQASYDMDHHWRVQSSQLLLPLVRYDLIGKIESFGEDLSRLDNALGGRLKSYLKPIAPHRTDSQNRLGNYYNDSLRKKVYEKFQPDFKNFGYSEEFPA